MKNHTCNNRTPYSYVIRNLVTNKRYYGIKYAKGCHPDDFWVTYFTSSKNIKLLIDEYGIDQWEFEIRKIFRSVAKCKAWEGKVLRRLKVPNNINWYNQSIGGETFLLQGPALERQRNAVSKKMKFLNTLPEYKEYRLLVNERRWAKPGAKEKHSSQIKSYWKDPEWVKKNIEIKKEVGSRPEIREMRSRNMIEVWGRPEYQDKHKTAMKIVRSNPDWIENNSVKQTLAWQDPVKRDNMMKNRKPETEEQKKIRSAKSTKNNKESWADPEIRAKRIAGIQAACDKRKAEKELAKLNLTLPNKNS